MDESGFFSRNDMKRETARVAAKYSEIYSERKFTIGKRKID
jgi:hypothetical protein